MTRVHLSRWLAVEPLDERSLPSRTWSGSDPRSAVLSPTTHVRPAVPDDPDPALEPADLPPLIRRTVSGSLAGWTPLGASIDSDAGPAYIVQARRPGGTVEFQIDRHGTIHEAEEAVPVGEIPFHIGTWLAKHYPGASLGEVVRVFGPTGGSYEVVVHAADGREIEATLHDDGEPVAASAVNLASASTTWVASPVVSSFRAVELAGPPIARTVDAIGVHFIDWPAREPAPTFSVEVGPAAEPESSPNEDRLNEGDDTAERPPTSDRESDSPTQAEVAVLAALRTFVPIDIEAVERGLDRVLRAVRRAAIGDEPRWLWRESAALFLLGIAAVRLAWHPPTNGREVLSRAAARPRRLDRQ